MKILKNNQLDEIVQCINENKIIILPTDTQMGMICKIPDKIYELKKRDKIKKLILFINSYDDKHSNNFKLLANNFWPGKLTLIENKIAYRKPNNKLILDILKEVKFIYSSSANISGEEPLNNSLDYVNEFKNEMSHEIVIVEGINEDNIASTIFDLDNNKIIRHGKINENQILDLIKKE